MTRMSFPASGRLAQLALLCAVFALVLLNTCDASRRGKSRSKDAFEKAGNETTKGARKGKLFSLFNVVTFDNDPCASTSTVNGISRNGTCYTSTECDDKGGSANGNCAAGFGVCCIFTVDGTNGRTTVDNNCTYIQNDGYPSAVTGASTNSFTINKCNDDVCFLRLDFETFTLLGTGGTDNENEGDCTDTFTITTPTAMRVPTICGENTGQHIYVDIGANSGDTATLMIATTATAANRMWDIKVTQIECNNENAPRDSCCLQYYTGCTGRLTSFNYENANDNHLNNQQYEICIRQECGFCCVEYSVCPDQMNLLPGAAGAAMIVAGWSFDTAQTVSKNDGGCVDSDNNMDYIGIPQSSGVCSPSGGSCDRATNSRYCGQSLNGVRNQMTFAPICDCTAPFGVDVHFNNAADNAVAAARGAVPTKQSRGFCLDYRQIPC